MGPIDEEITSTLRDGKHTNFEELLSKLSVFAQHAQAPPGCDGRERGDHEGKTTLEDEWEA